MNSAVASDVVHQALPVAVSWGARATVTTNTLRWTAGYLLGGIIVIGWLLKKTAAALVKSGASR